MHGGERDNQALNTGKNSTEKQSNGPNPEHPPLPPRRSFNDGRSTEQYEVSESGSVNFTPSWSAQSFDQNGVRRPSEASHFTFDQHDETHSVSGKTEEEYEHAAVLPFEDSGMNDTMQELSILEDIERNGRGAGVLGSEGGGVVDYVGLGSMNNSNYTTTAAPFEIGPEEVPAGRGRSSSMVQATRDLMMRARATRKNTVDS
eukprot:CAMPEP_0170371330 /NCGR_PEP_ID=MMETSP0117_2-20130122/8974_1 /TAXON_ID=400756 /ORGANISM="Durinskia baltica, Strain CSIRO CS-38" /LENGTH=201 /DNA_ID=CAMNT_0010626139 /DNA_START=74 /DNA_END=675 /DNA_ORIENTATION=+